MQHYMFIDCATTTMHSKLELSLEKLKEMGYSKKEEVRILAQFSYLLTDELLNIIEKGTVFTKPDVLPTFYSMENNGITPEMVEKEDYFSDTDIFKKVKNHLDTKDIVICGHNVSFDIEVLKAEGLDLNEYIVIDTLQLAKRYCREESNRLEYLFYANGLYKKLVPFINNNKLFSVTYNGKKIEEISQVMRNSMFHCIATYLLLENIIFNNKLNLKDMTEVSSTTILLKEMPYGKHKGTSIHLLEDAYILYFMKNPIEDKNLKITLKNEIDKRGGLKAMFKTLNHFQITNLIKEADGVEKDFLDTANEVLNEKIDEQLVFSYGKYKDTHIKEVLEKDPGYIDFMKTNGKLNNYMLTFLEG